MHFHSVQRKQQIVSQSFAEVEYISIGLAIQQAIWLERILEYFGEKQEALTIHCDNNQQYTVTKNLVFHRRIKHTAIKHHFIQEAIEEEDVQLKFCKSGDQLTNIFTKTLDRGKFHKPRGDLVVQEQPIKGHNFE